MAPVVLVAIYLYFHFYLQMMWDELAQLPAVFPDGKPLHQKSYPWLANDLVRSHFYRLRPCRPLLCRLEYGLSVFFGWFLIPLTLLAYWERFLCRHDRWSSMLQAAAVVVAVWGGALLYCYAIATLEGAGFSRGGAAVPPDPRGHPGARTGKRRTWRAPSRAALVWSAASCVIGLLLAGVSLAAIGGVPPDRYEGKVLSAVAADASLSETDPRRWVPWVLHRCFFSPFADLVDADVARRSDEGGKAGALPGRGVLLRRADLRYAGAVRTFLAGADLRGSDLTGADLAEAVLTRALLSDATLTGAWFCPGRLLGEAAPSGQRPSALPDPLTGADLGGSGPLESHRGPGGLPRREPERRQADGGPARRRVADSRRGGGPGGFHLRQAEGVRSVRRSHPVLDLRVGRPDGSDAYGRKHRLRAVRLL